MCGGNSYGDSAVELNPHYYNYRNEHEAWLKQQQQLQQQQFNTLQGNTQNYSNRSATNKSLPQRIQTYFTSLHQLSPSLFYTNVLCILVFVLWQIPQLLRDRNGLLLRWFLNSRANARRTSGVCLLLSAISHKDLFHILANLATLSHVGPSVARLVQAKGRTGTVIPNRKSTSTIQQALWPLLISSAIVSNLVFLLGRPLGSSLGLSGVTMTLLAIQAMDTPNRIFTIFLAVFPVSLPAYQILQILVGTSIIGSFVPRSRISHLTHLGGLLYGIVYQKLFLSSKRR